MSNYLEEANQYLQKIRQCRDEVDGMFGWLCFILDAHARGDLQEAKSLFREWEAIKPRKHYVFE